MDYIPAMGVTQLFGIASILVLIVFQLAAAAAATSIAPGVDRPTESPGQNGTSGRFSDPGTEPDLREIFIGRCADYKAGKVNPTADLDELREKNCTQLWELFSKAFMYRDACEVNETDYEPFVEAASISIPQNKSNFWDGWDIYDTVRAYANQGRRTWTIEFTLVGYLVNNLKFCGQVEPPGVRYDSCPAEGECGLFKGCVDAFWAVASRYFAKLAIGNAYVFLNSNREGGAFHVNNSFFTSFELVNLSPEKVNRLNIYLITDIGKKTGDDCNSSSIVTMKKMLEAQSINYTCYDQPRDVLHQLCIDDANYMDCMLQQDVQDVSTEGNLPYTTDGAKSTRRLGDVSSLVAGSICIYIFSLLRLLSASHT